MAAIDVQKVIDVHHWTDRLFSFRTTRDQAFRFVNGQFVMIGLPTEGRPLMRAYSMASANYEDTLEFFSIKVPDGPLTSRLAHISAGDDIMVGHKPTGTLVQDSLIPGKRLYLVSTGTGIAPFVSIIKDPDVYDRFDKVILVHGCRFIDELAYGREIVAALPQDEFLGDIVRDKLAYYPTATREPFVHEGRVTELLRTGKISDDLGVPALDAEDDRVMICGSPAMLSDMIGLMDELEFDEGSVSRPGQYVIEKAFVER